MSEHAALRAELSVAALRFTITRITDYALPRPSVGARVIKDWRRFRARYLAVQAIDPAVLFR